MKKQPWGLELQLDLFNCNPQTIRDAGSITEFTYKLCKLIEMKTYGNIQIVHFGEEERVAGFSMTQLIETSLISGHFANASNSVFLNIFSCKTFSADMARIYAISFFEAKAFKSKLTKRG